MSRTLSTLIVWLLSLTAGSCCLFGPSHTETTEFFRAVEAGDADRVGSMLAADSCLASARHQFGRLTALHFAVMSRDVRVIDVLLAHGADPNAADSNGATPLHFACRGRGVGRALTGAQERGLLDALFRAGSKPSIPDVHGATPLHWAAVGGDLEAAAALIDRGARVDAVARNQGWTPLHGAAAEGHAEIVDLLLARGADPGAVDASGRTPLAMAEAGQHPRVVDQLQRAMARR